MSFEPPDRVIHNGVTYRILRNSEVTQLLLKQTRYLLSWQDDAGQERLFVLSEETLKEWCETEL